ncbi:MAG: glycosyltransferase family 2 protein [Ignavibacteria bacterium]
MITGEVKYEVSVILTLYNSKKFFRRAVDSVVNQTFRDFELIIIDDGSTDKIENEIFPLLKQNDNFKYLRHSNRGHPLSLNEGIMTASGRFVTFIDSDDEYKPKHIEERVNYFAINASVDIIYSLATLVGDENDFYVPDAKDRSKLIHLNDCYIGGTFFGKREVFEELEGFKNIYSHDSEFFERAQNKFVTMKYDSPTYIYYRNNPDSVISKLKKAATDG